MLYAIAMGQIKKNNKNKKKNNKNNSNNDNNNNRNNAPIHYSKLHWVGTNTASHWINYMHDKCPPPSLHNREKEKKVPKSEKNQESHRITINYRTKTCCLLLAVNGSSVDTWNIISHSPRVVNSDQTPVESAAQKQMTNSLQGGPKCTLSVIKFLVLVLISDVPIRHRRLTTGRLSADTD